MIIEYQCIIWQHRITQSHYCHNNNNNTTTVVQVQRPTPSAIPSTPITTPITSSSTTLTPTPKIAPVPLLKRHGEDEDYETASDDGGSDKDENFDPYRDFKRGLKYRSILESKTK